MNKKLIASLAGIIKTDASVVEADLLKDDGDDSVINEFKSKYPNVLTAVELHTMLENTKKKFLEEYSPNPGEIPQKLYNTVKLATLLPIEKGIATKHGITDYDGIDDLLNKVSEKLTSGKGNTDETLKQQIKALEEANKNLLKDKETGIKAAEEKYNGELVSREKSSALKNIPLDYEDDPDESKSLLKKTQTLIDATFNSKFKVDWRDGEAVVLGPDGKPVVDALGSNKKVSSVYNEVAAEYGFKLKTVDPGNRGLPGSPPNTGGSGLKGKTLEEVQIARGLKTTDSGGAHDAVFAEWRAANPKQ